MTWVNSCGRGASPTQDGSPSHMSIARMLVPRDPEVTVRAPDAIVASLEEQVKRWNTPEEQEDDYYTAVAKKPRMEDKRSEL